MGEYNTVGCGKLLQAIIIKAFDDARQLKDIPKLDKIIAWAEMRPNRILATYDENYGYDEDVIRKSLIKTVENNKHYFRK